MTTRRRTKLAIAADKAAAGEDSPLPNLHTVTIPVDLSSADVAAHDAAVSSVDHVFAQMMRGRERSTTVDGKFNSLLGLLTAVMRGSGPVFECDKAYAGGCVSVCVGFD